MKKREAAASALLSLSLRPMQSETSSFLDGDESSWPGPLVLDLPWPGARLEKRRTINQTVSRVESSRIEIPGGDSSSHPCVFVSNQIGPQRPVRL